jgi:hypothetical protein
MQILAIAWQIAIAGKLHVSIALANLSGQASAMCLFWLL